MKKSFFLIAICLCNVFCWAQKTYLAGLNNVPIDVTCEEFRQYISRECRCLGDYVVASFEESPQLYDEMAETYLTNDVWGHGRTHVYVICKEGRVKQVYMEFPWGDNSELGSEPMSVFTWGACEVFPKYCGYGEPSEKGHVWNDANQANRYYLYSSWYRPDNIKVTIRCYWRWPNNPYGDRGELWLEGSVARTEIIYEVL